MSIKSIGAMWKPREGKKYVMSGTIDFLGEPIKFFVYKNERKEKDEHPDFNMVRIFDDKKKQEGHTAPYQPGPNNEEPPPQDDPWA